MLKYALLGFLNYRSMSGYDLERYINASTGNFWHAKLSQIYMALKGMEGEGLVESHIEPGEGRPDRRVYDITGAGRAALTDWLSTPITSLEPEKNTLLLKLFFARQTGKDAILTQLRLQRDLHRKQLERYTGESAQAIQRAVESNPAIADETILWEATRRYGVLYEEMILHWLDETIHTVDSSFPDGE